jgi:hypothetical protein
MLEDEKTEKVTMLLEVWQELSLAVLGLVRLAMLAGLRGRAFNSVAGCGLSEGQNACERSSGL